MKHKENSENTRKENTQIYIKITIYIKKKKRPITKENRSRLMGKLPLNKKIQIKKRREKNRKKK